MSLIAAIRFDIHDFQNNTTEEFLIENTIENQEKVLGHRKTRNIRFEKVFSFQFDKEMAMPLEFINNSTWVAMVNANPELFAAVADDVLSV